MKLPIFLGLAATALCSTVSLPAYALAVKTPYLSTWFPGGSTSNFPTMKPFFWTRAPLTWVVAANVNGQAYCLLGCTGNSLVAAKQTGVEFTATHTLVTLTAGSATFTLDFFSPVSLTDYVRQSIPFSYLTVSVQGAKSTDSVHIMSGIDDTWTAQTNTQLNLTSGKSSLLLQLSGRNSIPLTENKDMATYGQFVLAAATGGASVSYQAAQASTILSQFKSNGTLTSPKNPAYSHGDMVAFSYALKNPATSTSVSFAIGHVRDPAIMWLNEPQSSYYTANFSKTEDVVDHFFSDEAAARSESSQLDSKIKSLGSTISSNYTDLLESSIRQIWGGFELTVPTSSKDTSQAKAFMKEISTDGNVNTLADLIPKALPAFYVLAPDYIRLLLEPIMQYTLQWPGQFAFHDLGKHYPNATGETVAGEEKLLIDQTAVLQWMVLAYQKATGDTNWVKPYLAPLQKYAGYLVKTGLYPPSQSSSVDSIGPTPNQTLLAMYAAVGLTAYGAISGETNYTQTGLSYAPQIVDMGTDSKFTHIKAHYNDTDDAWISTYPLAFDVMLGLNTFNASTRQRQSDWYETQLHPLGMQFYNGVNYTVSELSLWCGATSSDTVLNSLINGIHAVLTSNLNVVVGPTQWNVVGPNQGVWFLSTAKSIIGSYFMPLAVNS